LSTDPDAAGHGAARAVSRARGGRRRTDVEIRGLRKVAAISKIGIPSERREKRSPQQALTAGHRTRVWADPRIAAGATRPFI